MGGGGSRTILPDWNQNDDTQPDYIRNRICYEVFGKEYTVREMSVSGVEIPIIEGHRYRVKGRYMKPNPSDVLVYIDSLQDGEYLYPKLDESDGKLYIGDLNKMSPPFYIKNDEWSANVSWDYMLSPTDITVIDFDASTIYPLDSKFLSPDVGRIAFINNPNFNPVEGEENAGVATITKEEYEKCVNDTTQYIIMRMGKFSEAATQVFGPKYVNANGIVRFATIAPNPGKNDNFAVIIFTVQPSQSEDNAYELVMEMTEHNTPPAISGVDDAGKLLTVNQNGTKYELTNKPTINGVEVNGTLTSETLLINKNVPTPTDGTDTANKQYVDNKVLSEKIAPRLRDLFGLQPNGNITYQLPEARDNLAVVFYSVSPDGTANMANSKAVKVGKGNNTTTDNLTISFNADGISFTLSSSDSTNSILGQYYSYNNT